MKEEVKEEKQVTNLFEELYNLDVREKVEQKNGLNYLSWAYAWAEIKRIYPTAKYNIYKFGDRQLPYVYDEKTGYMVFTDVTIEDITHEMWLPVMDGANKTMLDHPYKYQVKEYKDGKPTGKLVEKNVEAASMFDINKTIMRCLTKNLAMFGLGLALYQGEDLPTVATKEEAEKFVITFGKHQGKTLGEILSEPKNKNYVEWLYNNTKDENIRVAIELLIHIPTEEEQQEILKLMTEINKLAVEKGVDFDVIRNTYDVKSSKEMTLEELKDCVNWLKEWKEDE